MQSKKHMAFKKGIVTTFVLLDALSLWLLFLVFNLFRFENLDISTSMGIQWLIPFGFTFLALYIIDGYSPKRDLLSLEYASEHVIALVSAAILTVSVVYIFAMQPANNLGRGILPLVFLTFLPLSLLYRRSLSRWANKFLDGRKLLILGSGPVAQTIYQDCLESKLRQGLRFVEINLEKVGERLSQKDTDSPIVEGDPLWQLENLNGMHDAVVLAADRRGMPKEMVEKLIECHFGQVPILSVDKFYEEYFKRVPASIMHPQLLLGPGFQFARQPIFENIKRLIDITIASISLIIMSPLFLIIPALIKLEGKGPAIFKQARTGKNNQPFQVYKYRTMVQRENHGDACTNSNDNRITKLGKWLRASHLDEIPQIWNVFKGDMSIIGPRPEQHQLTQAYESQFPCYRFRHLVKPGITGWSQVNFNYGFDFNDAIKKFEYDLYYIRHYSFKLDAAILLKTAHLMVFGKGR